MVRNISYSYLPATGFLYLIYTEAYLSSWKSIQYALWSEIYQALCKMYLGVESVTLSNGMKLTHHRGEKILQDWFVLELGDLKFNLDIPSFYEDTFQLLTGRVNVFKKMADAFFKIIKQREEDQLLTTAYFSEEEMQIMERILEEVHGSDDIEG